MLPSIDEGTQSNFECILDLTHESESAGQEWEKIQGRQISD